MTDPTPSPTLTEACTAFLDGLRHTPNTHKTYATGLGCFVRFLEATTHVDGSFTVDRLDDGVLAAFHTWLNDRGYSKFTVRAYVAALSALLSYLVSRDQLPPTFSMERAKAKLRQVTRRTSYPIPVPDPELPRIIRYYDEMPLPLGHAPRDRLARLRILRSRAIVHTLYASAGRIAEIASLDRKHVADGRRSEAVITGKGDKQRFIFLTPEAQQAIAAYVTARQDTYQPLFISHGRNYGARLSTASIWSTVRQAAKALGLEVTPHDFRHFRASQMLEEGAPLEAIQEILGHADIGTTRRVYAHYSKPAIREIFARTSLSPEEALEKERRKRRADAQQAR